MVICLLSLYEAVKHPYGDLGIKSMGAHHSFRGYKSGFGTSCDVQPQKPHGRSFCIVF